MFGWTFPTETAQKLKKLAVREKSKLLYIASPVQSVPILDVKSGCFGKDAKYYIDMKIEEQAVSAK